MWWAQWIVTLHIRIRAFARHRSAPHVRELGERYLLHFFVVPHALLPELLVFLRADTERRQKASCCEGWPTAAGIRTVSVDDMRVVKTLLQRPRYSDPAQVDDSGQGRTFRSPRRC